jgi:hypothetical protein
MKDMITKILRKVYIFDLSILISIIVLDIITITKYKSTDVPGLLWNIYLVLFWYYIVKIILEFIGFFIKLCNNGIIKTKWYFMLIPHIVLSIIYIYLLFVIMNSIPILILAICVPIGQAFWINIIENKIFVVLSNTISIIISIQIFNAIFTGILNV